MSNVEQTATRFADVAAAGSIGGAVASFALEWTPVVQFLLIIVSIVAGLVAIFYHLCMAPRR